MGSTTTASRKGYVQEDDSESEFSNDSDSCSLTASKVPSYRPNNYNGGRFANGKHANSQDSGDELPSTNVSMDTSKDDEQMNEYDDEDDEEDEDGKVKEEPDYKDGDKQSKDGDKKRRRTAPPMKEIVAVQYMPKYKTLTKKRGAKISQQPGATEWQLPLYANQPYPAKSPGKKKRKREDTARFLLQITANFETGKCKLDECVFEDSRGTRLSEIVTRKFTPRKIVKSICKQLWNTTYWGVLTNGRRRSLYENNVFERKLRERGASAALLGHVVELLATTYCLMDLVHIWFADGSDETGLRLSTETFRVATEQPPRLPRFVPHNTTLRQSDQNSAELEHTNDSNGVISQPQSPTSNIPPSVPIFQIPQAPKVVPPPATLDTAVVLAKMLHDDRLRARIYNDPTLLYDLCCSLGLDKRVEIPPKPTEVLPPATTSQTAANNNTNHVVPLDATTLASSTTTPVATPATPAPSQMPSNTNNTNNTAVVRPSSPNPVNIPPTAHIDLAPATPPRGTEGISTPKLTITLTPKSPTISEVNATTTKTNTVPPASPPSPSHTQKRAAAAARGRKPASAMSRKYHRRRNDSPPKSPSQASAFPYNLGDPNDAQQEPTSTSSIFSAVKEEPMDEVPNSMTALRLSRAAAASTTSGTSSSTSSTSSVASTSAASSASSAASTSSTSTVSTTPVTGFDNSIANLKFSVESIDLGSDEEEKITFVATLKDGKKKRLHLTKASMKQTFPPETAKYYMEEVTKFREGSGNSSYRSVMNKRTRG